MPSPGLSAPSAIYGNRGHGWQQSDQRSEMFGEERGVLRERAFRRVRGNSELRYVSVLVLLSSSKVIWRVVSTSIPGLSFI